MFCKKFGELSDIQIEAVLQLTFQLIASANYGAFSEKDDPSINLMMDTLGFTGILLSLGNAYWNDAMEMSPHKAFQVVSLFDGSQKVAFKEAILAVADKDNSLLRHDIAKKFL